MEQAPHERQETVREVREEAGDPRTGATHQHYERVVRDVAAEHNMVLQRITQFLWTLVGILVGLLGLRILLKLIGANEQNGFVRFVYDLTELFVAPFVGIAENPTSGSLELDIAAIIAIVVYLLAAWAVIRLLWVFFARSGARAVSRAERTVTRDDRA